jgi:hypothetical protein
MSNLSHLEKKANICSPLKNRIETAIYVFAERKNKTKDQVVSELIQFLSLEGNQLSWWINNTSQPDLQEALLIAQFFEKSVSDIFFLE